jgi:hypothetical protein
MELSISLARRPPRRKRLTDNPFFAAPQTLKTVATAVSRKSLPISLARCPACHVPWSVDETIRIPADGLADEMLSDSLREQLRELVYERCSVCGALIATDSRRDPQLLNAIYEQLPASYWSGLNAQIGLNATIQRRLSERGIAGGELWDIGCGNGNLLSTFGNGTSTASNRVSAQSKMLAVKASMSSLALPQRCGCTTWPTSCY